jgi:hypothetical protein
MKYRVHTLDNKHNPEDAGRALSPPCSPHLLTEDGRHISTTCGKSRMFTDILKIFQMNSYCLFDHIALDYFFAPGPDNYQEQCWGSFLEEDLPNLSATNILADCGSIWLPAWDCVVDRLNRVEILTRYHVIPVPKETHPLWVASLKAEEISKQTLKRSFVNEDQVPAFGFLRLVKKENVTIVAGFRRHFELMKRHHPDESVMKLFKKLNIPSGPEPGMPLRNWPIILLYRWNICDKGPTGNVGQ